MKKTSFAILCLEGAVLSFNFAAGATLVPSIAKEFNSSQFVVGMNNWIYMLAYGAAALLYGPLVTLFDAKKIELFCFFLFCLANLVAAFSHNLGTFFIARFFMGIFGASVVPLVFIVIGRYAKAENRGKLVGVFFSITFFASLAGLFLSGIIPWRMIFLIPAIFGLVLWIHMRRYLEDFRTSTDTLTINYRAALKNKAVVLIFTYIFFISVFYYGLQQWLGVYLSQKYNFAQFIISMLVTLTSLSGILGELAGGWFSDALGRIKTINSGIVLMILAVVLLLCNVPKIVLAVIMIVWGIGWTLNHAGLSALLTDMPAQFLNESASLNSSVRFLAGGLGALMGGILMKENFNLHFIVCGTGLFLLALFSKTLLRTKDSFFGSATGRGQKNVPMGRGE